MSRADAEKELGNTAYKQKNFTDAIKHYDKAIELDPTNAIFYTNKAAVYFEMGELDKSIELCEKAVEVGRENRAEYKVIAKALSRIGRCYDKREDLINAKKYYEKSLAESRQLDVDKRIKEISKLLAEKERLAYINPELAEEERLKGNELFQQGKFPEAIARYTEAIKRNPDDPRVYSNRAACYMKLIEFGSALKDSNTCLEKDPKFIKGYLRKASACTALKDLNQARKAYNAILEIDPQNNEAHQGLMSTYMSDEDPETARKQALNDPEVMEILSDPAMQMILKQLEDPKAQREHLKNPEIKAKVMKLIQAGLISFK